MSKYKLINTTNKEEHLCDKVTIDGFDYYVSDELPKQNDAVITAVGNIHYIKDDSKDFIEYVSKLGKVLIATNNPNIDILKVVNKVEKMANIHAVQSGCEYREDLVRISKGYLTGYNKSQETHPNSDDDMIAFNEFSIGLLHKQVNGVGYYDYNAKWITTKELLQLWKEQQPKIMYYE